MAKSTKPNQLPRPPVLSGASLIATVLKNAQADVAAKQTTRDLINLRRVARGQAPKKTKASLSYAIAFARHMGAQIAAALEYDFPGVRSGETPSESVRGPKRLDLNYSTPEMGLGFAMSFKSVHQGERNGGDADFTHNLKRNDEEWRVEATAHHLRQPYAVLVAVVFLPNEAFNDLPTSSFAQWVQYMWPLKGRVEPEDPPDIFELAFVCTYARDASELNFYKVGGPIAAPRHGRPRSLLTFAEFLDSVTAAYRNRNDQDFAFEGE